LPGNGSGVLQVGDDATSYAHDVCQRSTAVVIQCSGRSPHLAVLQQVRINERAQLSAMTSWGHSTVGFQNPCQLKSAGNATWTHDKFSGAVWTTFVHLVSAVHTKGALKTADESFAGIDQVDRALLTYTTHL
jgi:hypothetical protein